MTNGIASSPDPEGERSEWGGGRIENKREMHNNGKEGDKEREEEKKTEEGGRVVREMSDNMIREVTRQ